MHRPFSIANKKLWFLPPFGKILEGEKDVLPRKIPNTDLRT